MDIDFFKHKNHQHQSSVYGISDNKSNYTLLMWWFGLRMEQLLPSLEEEYHCWHNLDWYVVSSFCDKSVHKIYFILSKIINLYSHQLLINTNSRDTQLADRFFMGNSSIFTLCNVWKSFQSPLSQISASKIKKQHFLFQ